MRRPGGAVSRARGLAQEIKKLVSYSNVFCISSMHKKHIHVSIAMMFRCHARTFREISIEATTVISDLGGTFVVSSQCPSPAC
jgi:hypothetical protein